MSVTTLNANANAKKQRKVRSSKVFPPDQLSFLRDKLPTYKKLGDSQKSRDREEFLGRTAVEFENRFLSSDNPGPIFSETSRYKYVSIYSVSLTGTLTADSAQKRRKNSRGGSTTLPDISTRAKWPMDEMKSQKKAFQQR